MKLIQNNPYRIVGLLVGATAREQERQVKRLKQFIEAEQEPQDDFSFPSIGKLHRTIENVNDAASKLNLDSDKMSAALFWFYNGNAITDEPAFDTLKEGNQENSSEIWKKLTANGEVTQRNVSAFQNLSTLFLCNAFNGSSNKESLLEQAVFLKLKFLESDFVKEFKKLATDETYKTTKKDIQLLFLNQLQSEIEKSKIITSDKLLEILNKQDFSAKEDFLKGFIRQPIERIEKKIEESKSKRKGNKEKALSIGRTLYNDTVENLKQLKSILGTSNITFSSISDKVADEILQCGIDYFKYCRDNTENSLGIPQEHSKYTGGTSEDFSNASMDLFRKAKSFAIGNIAKQRCEENTENLQEWIDNKPEREKQQKILKDFEKLKGLIDEYDGLSETVSNAKQLLSSARPFLYNIKTVLGGYDELYLGLSTRIASDAQSMCVSEINKLQEKFSSSYDSSTKVAAIILLKQRVNEAWDITTTISGMDLTQDFRTRCTTNRNSLSNLKTQLAEVNTGTRSSSSGSSGGGCYIATMAYGDYNHPQVLILREFRDNVLGKSLLGRGFIRLYYRYSPLLVEKLKDKKGVNSMVKKILNQIIKFIE